jgi:hypothetical protein
LKIMKEIFQTEMRPAQLREGNDHYDRVSFGDKLFGCKRTADQEARKEAHASPVLGQKGGNDGRSL